MSTRVGLARVARVAALLLSGALLAGCVQMPTSGPVVESEVSRDVEDVPGISFDPRPPRPGEAPSDIVEGFLEAMKATPVRTTVARQFLSRQAAEAWVPEKQIITYGELGDPTPGTAVRIQLADVARYDARGAWVRRQARVVISLELVQEDGEWRISDLPDALLVPESWFGDWYQRAAVYYFDPTAEVLVPEPVYVPRGEQFPSSLVRSLLARPREEAADLTRTYFPPGTRPGLLPIESGIARVALSGDPDAVDDESARRMLAQLVWTLGQDPRIGAVDLSIGDRTFAGPGGLAPVNLNFGAAYDPTGDLASSDLYALDQGRVVAGTLENLAPTTGPLGQGDYTLRSVSASVTGSRLAGVDSTGTELLFAATDMATGDVLTPITGAQDLAKPAWDLQERVWALDRGNTRARIFVVTDGVASEVTVPGLSGANLTRLLVSRDGTRLVAIRRARAGDTVVSVRVRHDTAGAVVGFTPVVRLPLEGEARIRDIGWRSPTTVSVLSDINDDLSQVRTISVDGSPGEIATGGATRLRGRNRVLVSAPTDAEVYVVAGRAVTSLTRPERAVSDLPSTLTSLGYAG